jgi:hypothetical protein
MAHPERGAALVEATVVLPVLLFLIFAIIEIGGLMRSYSGAASAVRVGGRSASLAGSDPLADQVILDDLARQAATMGKDAIELVVIWHATGPGDQVPAACLPATTTSANTASIGSTGQSPSGLGACNVYVQPGLTGGAFDMAAGTAAQPVEHYFGCSGSGDPEASHKLDCSWPATTRQVLTSPRGSTTPTATDFVGVYVRARHEYYTGILGTGITITDRSITLIEPQGYELS